MQEKVFELDEFFIEVVFQKNSQVTLFATVEYRPQTDAMMIKTSEVDGKIIKNWHS